MQQAIQLQQGNGQIVEAWLCTMQQRHLDDFNTIWKSMLEELVVCQDCFDGLKTLKTS